LPPSPPQQQPPTVTHEVSYAHQTLSCDGIAAALIIAGSLQGDDGWVAKIVLRLSGGLVYAFGAPIVHLGNDQAGKGARSVGVRLGLPLLGMLAGDLLGPKDEVQCVVGEPCPESSGSSLGLAIGWGVGALAASALDVIFFAHKRVTEPAPRVAPTIGYSRSGVTVGLGGSI
jgi:hypothetical protein